MAKINNRKKKKRYREYCPFTNRMWELHPTKGWRRLKQTEEEKQKRNKDK